VTTDDETSPSGELTDKQLDQLLAAANTEILQHIEASADPTYEPPSATSIEPGSRPRQSAAKILRRRAETGPLLTPAQVATMFHVDPKTITRWAKAGKLTPIRTLGGHRRYSEAEVRALLAGIPQRRPE
jgi:excisionase family DNA binding protein